MTLFRRMWRLRDAYQSTFGKGQWRRDGQLTEDALLTLKNLAPFCRAFMSAYEADPRNHALLEGRREVWLEISRVLNLSDEDLMKLREPMENPDD